MPFVDDSGKPVTLSPEEQSQYWAAQKPQAAPGSLVGEDGKPVDPFRDLSSQDLAGLARQSPEQFDLIPAFQSRPDLMQDPAVVDKVADAYHDLSQDWLTGISVKGAVKNVAGIVPGFARAASNATGGTALLLNSLFKASRPGATPEEIKDAEDDNSAGRKALATFWSGAESNMFGLLAGAHHLAEKAGRKIGEWIHGEAPDQEDKRNRLFDAMAVHQTAGELASGKGAVSQAITGGVPEQQPNPEEVAKQTDPFSWWAMGGALKGLGAVVPDAAKAAVSSGLETAGEKLAQGVGTAADFTARGAAKMVGAGEAVAPWVTVPGILGAAAAGHTHALWGLLAGGEHGVSGRVIDALKRGEEGLKAAGEFSKQVAGTAPMKSAYAQLIRDSLEATPQAAATLGEGVGFDAAQAMAGDTPQEREAAVGIGTAFGLAGAAGGTGRHVLSGQIIAPRQVGPSTPVAPNNSFPALNAIHNAQFGNLTPGQQVRVNAVRAFLRTANPKADLFVTGDSTPAEVSTALQGVGVRPEMADEVARQQGATLKLPDGKTLLVVKEPTSGPHEAFHSIEDVLGEDTMRNLDESTKQQYANQWQDFGQYYASRLAGKNVGPAWRDPLLNLSGWGRAAAIEKLWRQYSNQFMDEARKNGTPPPAEDQVKNAVVQAFQSAGENWNQVLGPEEAQEVADRYVAREKQAENFDAWFKHAGPTLDPGKQLPEKAARLVGKFISALGGNPTAGRSSEALGVPLNEELINEIRSQIQTKVLGKGTAAPLSEPEVAPRQKAKSASTRQPTEPLGAQQPEQTAREVAQEAPDVPAQGASLTQRQVSNILADQVGSGGGVRLVYRSAPGEPAAAPTQSRNTRRAIYEYARTMPADQKPLWQKLFFPWRVDQTKAGEQLWGGWVPEVLAANANRVAQWAAESGNTGLVPYQVDPQAKTFTNAGWQRLMNDVQAFAHNQLAGRTGSGIPLEIPKNVREAGGFAPELGPSAERQVGQNEADFISMLFGTGQLPKTARISTRKLGLPLSIAGAEVSEATLPGRTQPPVVPRGTFTGEKAEAMGIAGRDVMEVNPLRAELERAGQSAKAPLPKMLEAYQNLNLRDIVHAEPAPEQPKFGANTLTLSAGFLPQKLSPEKEATIRGRIAAGIKPEHLQFSVFNDPRYPQFSFVQADEINRDLPSGKQNTFSSNPETLRELGMDIPSSQELLKLPMGKYTLPEALEKLKGPDTDGSAQFSPARLDKNDEIRSIAAKYAKAAGRAEAPHAGVMPVDENRAKQIADLYAGLKHDPENPEVKKSYAAFADETMKQWDQLTAAGYRMEPWEAAGQPYANSAEMAADVRDNKHLWFFPTDRGFGESTGPENHPLLTDSGLSVNGVPLAVNDVFRAVHDVFGHAKEGYEFGPKGEFNAYLAHSRMYSPEARPAMAAETLGQNSWVNYGSHLRNAEGNIPRRGEPGFVPAPERPFAEQKAAILPPHILEPAEPLNAAPESAQYVARKSKTDYELREAPGQLFSKAWVLPDGKVVQLGGQWHHEWVNQNPEIAKRFGLKPTTSGEDNRVDALKRGFARVNYERNTGTLKVEARSVDWPKLAPSIKELVKRNLDRIDNMDVHLLDARAQKIVDSDGVALHTYSRDEKMDQIPFISAPSPTTTVSPQASAEAAKFLPAADETRPDEARSEGIQYMPGGDPRAIRAAAIRDDKGEVVEAPIHFMARINYMKDHRGFDPLNFFRFEEGFVDNSGNFLNRVEAFQRAKELDQLKKAETPGQQALHDQFDKLGRLAAERAQFSPSKAGEPEKILESGEEGSAIKLPDNRIFRGVSHRTALGRANETGNYTPEDLGNAQEGYLTSRGRFVDRETGYKIAVKAKQFKEKDYLEIAKEEELNFKGKPYLETYTFDDATERAQFSPNTSGYVGYTDADELAHSKKVSDMASPNNYHDKLFPASRTGVEWRYVPKNKTLYTHGDFQTEVAQENTIEHLKKLGHEVEKIKDLSFGVTEKTWNQAHGQFLPAAPAAEEFKDEKTLPAALSRPNWAIFTATQESLGAGTDEVNRVANENLEKALRAAGFNPIVVKGSYKGVDQGLNFLVPGMTPQEALRWGREYGQESVLLNKGLLYGDGSLSQSTGDVKTGEAAKKQDFYSQIAGGPAFSLGIDFSKRIPAAVDVGALPGFAGEIGSPKTKHLSTMEKGNMTMDQLATHFPETVKPRKKDEAIPSEIVGSPLYKKAGNEQAAVKAFADRLVSFAKQYQDHPAFEDGKTWYDHIAPKIKKHFGKTGQLFAELLAATSPGQKPDTNFADALAAHDRAVAGHYDKQSKKLIQGLDMVEKDTWRPWLAKHGRDLPENVSPETFLGQWIDFHDLKPRKENGSLYGYNSVQVLKVAARRWLQEAGPKTSNFIQNLLGTGHEATIDLRADRTMRWAGYEGFKDRWRILPENKSGVSDADFQFSQKAFSAAAKELGMRPDQLQGALWFAEKQRWADNGWSPLDLGTYEPEFAKIDQRRAKVRQEREIKDRAKSAPTALTGAQQGFSFGPEQVQAK